MCDHCVWDEPLAALLDYPACYQCQKCGHCVILTAPKEITVPCEILEAYRIACEWADARGWHHYQANHVAERAYYSLVGWPVVYRN